MTVSRLKQQITDAKNLALPLIEAGQSKEADALFYKSLMDTSKEVKTLGMSFIEKSFKDEKEAITKLFLLMIISHIDLAKNAARRNESKTADSLIANADIYLKILQRYLNQQEIGKINAYVAKGRSEIHTVKINQLSSMIEQRDAAEKELQEIRKTAPQKTQPEIEDQALEKTPAEEAQKEAEEAAEETQRVEEAQILAANQIKERNDKEDYDRKENKLTRLLEICRETPELMRGYKKTKSHAALPENPILFPNLDALIADVTKKANEYRKIKHKNSKENFRLTIYTDINQFLIRIKQNDSHALHELNEYLNNIDHHESRRHLHVSFLQKRLGFKTSIDSFLNSLRGQVRTAMNAVPVVSHAIPQPDPTSNLQAEIDAFNSTPHTYAEKNEFYEKILQQLTATLPTFYHSAFFSGLHYDETLSKAAVNIHSADDLILLLNLIEKKFTSNPNDRDSQDVISTFHNICDIVKRNSDYLLKLNIKNHDISDRFETINPDALNRLNASLTIVLGNASKNKFLQGLMEHGRNRPQLRP